MRSNQPLHRDAHGALALLAHHVRGWAPALGGNVGRHLSNAISAFESYGRLRIRYLAVVFFPLFPGIALGWLFITQSGLFWANILGIPLDDTPLNQVSNGWLWFVLLIASLIPAGLAAMMVSYYSMATLLLLVGVLSRREAIAFGMYGAVPESWLHPLPPNQPLHPDALTRARERRR